MQFPEGFVIKADPSYSGRENFFRLLRQFSNPDCTYNEKTIKVGTPYANSDPRRFHNTEVLIKSQPGGGFKGEVVFKYNRYDLTALHDSSKVLELPLVQPKAFTIVQFEPTRAICEHFGLIESEVELSFDRCVEDGFSTCWVRAKRNSLVYCRSFLVHFSEYVATPSPKLPRRKSPVEAAVNT